MRARDIGSLDLVVSGEHVGPVAKRRNNMILMSGTQSVTLDEDAEVRTAMPREKAQRLLKELATAGSTSGVDKLTLIEIGGVLRMPQRALRAIVARGNGTIDRLESPEDYKDHDYMGAIEVGEELIVADRVNLAKADAKNASPLARVIRVLPGVWHMYIRHAPVHFDVSIAMFAVHENHFKAATLDGEELGTVGVDSAGVVMVDGRARDKAAMFAEDREWQEGMVDDLGCFAWTATGDGVYPLRICNVSDRAVVVRASLAGPDEAYYQPPAAPKPPPTKKYTKAFDQKMAAAGDAREYSPKIKFALGERVTHPKFGDGVVTAVLADGKVTIDFVEGSRTLVHGR